MIGQIINYRYEVLEKVGDGDIFAVFKARDKVLNRLVVLKVLSAELAEDGVFAPAVRAGYQAVMRLDHPNLARVMEADAASDDPYVVCDYVRGINVKDRVRRAGPIAVPLALDIAIGVLEALEYAHAQRVVHGDIRPQDIIVSPDGEVKLTDFGLASALRNCPGLANRFAMRSAQYQSPETAEGGAPSVSSDLYSVGVIMYEMLTGVVPFDGPTAVAIALKQMKDEPVPPRSLNAGVPKSLNDVILRAIEKSPRDRFGDASSMLADLRAIRDALRIGKPLSISQPVVSAMQVERPRVEAESENSELSLKKPMIWLGVIFITVFLAALGLTLYVSQGLRNPVKVPSILGKTWDEADSITKAAGLTLQEDTDDGPADVFSETFREGTICRVKPPVGVTAPPDRIIKVKISKGSSRRRVPDLVGMHESDAYGAADKAGFSVTKVTQAYSDKAPIDSVISQKPAANETSAPGTTIELVVSQGPKPQSDNPNDGMGNSAGTDYSLDVSVAIPSSAQGAQEVKIVLVNDDQTETQLYDGYHDPGETFSEPVTTDSQSPHIRVYVGGRVVSDETYQTKKNEKH